MSFGLSAGATATIPPTNPQNFTGIYDNSEYPTPDTLYTVPAGRTLYITGVSMTASSATATLLVKVNGTTKFITGGTEQTPSNTYGFPIFVVNGGEVLTAISGSGGESLYYNVFGFLL